LPSQAGSDENKLIPINYENHEEKLETWTHELFLISHIFGGVLELIKISSPRISQKKY